MTTGENGSRPLPPAQRNTHPNSVLENTLSGFGSGEEYQPHPGELLFQIESLRDLVIKSDIPEQMGQVLWRMLWKAERYKIKTLADMIEWYLLVRLGTERRAREEFINVVIGAKKKEQDELAELGRS